MQAPTSSTSHSLSRRILKEIHAGALSSEFDFYYDGDGAHGESGCAYLRFTVKAGTYAGQVHVLRIKFSYGSNEVYTFPRNPPNVTFETPIFHPNISVGGAICLDVIKPEKWSPMYGLETIFNSIIALLDSPNTNSPFNGDASSKYTHYRDHPEAFVSLCTEYYRQQTSRNAKAKKLLALAEFDLPLKEKILLHGVPESLWPAELK
jgi:ubiquitin-protein ligase